MKREYDFDRISNEIRFNAVQVEKVCRISDILESVASVPFMRNRLSLYGGTALAFIHFDAIERLSVDIDFNYRHIDEDDWSVVRNRVDNNMKTILYSLEYSDTDIRINSSYPLNRFTVKYTNSSGRPDEISIETGYMRRIPLLENDGEYDFYHVGTHSSFKIMTPVKEELFSNKWCTMLYRCSPRDLFDVYRIAQSSFDGDLFRKTAVVDSLLRGLPRLLDIDHQQKIKSIRFDSSLMNVLYQGNTFNEELVHEAVMDFTMGVLDDLSVDEVQLIETFYDEHRVDEKVISRLSVFNDEISNHPLIKWQIKELSRR